MTFRSPELLIFLLAIPVAVYLYVVFDRRRRSGAATWSAPALLPNMASNPGWRRRVPALLFLLAATLLLVGFARPEARFTQVKPGATIVLAIDTSGSMAASDVPPSRLLAGDEILAQFIDKLPSAYRLALVTFSADYALRVPPTSDRAAIIQALPRTTALQATAIGDAVAGSVQVAQHAVGAGKPSSRPPAAVLVVSDGGNNSGQISPAQATALAKKYGVPVSAIVLGTPAGSVQQRLQVTGSKQKVTETIQVPVEPQSLKLIAQGSGGAFFDTSASPAQLDAVYQELGHHLVHDQVLREITTALAGAGIALIVVGAVLSGLWFRRLI